ncbi:MAG: YafY family protein [Paracoccaceae bacterium]
MRRKDRLLALISALRDGKTYRAEDLARALQVTPRTIYRDMNTLVASGVPVGAARGVGYRMTDPVTLPPMNLTMAELEALHLGIAVMTEAADPALQDAARSLAQKVDAALPEDRVAPSTAWGLAVFPFADAAAGIRNIPAIRSAIRSRHKLRIRYYDNAGQEEEHLIRPLKLEYWGRVWTCTAWCERRKGFRTFRVDQIGALSELSARFDDETGKTLEDFTSTKPD